MQDLVEETRLDGFYDIGVRNDLALVQVQKKLDERNRALGDDRFLLDQPQPAVFDGEADLPYVLAVILEHPGDLLQFLEEHRIDGIDILADRIDVVEFFLEEFSLQDFFARHDVPAEVRAGA